MNNEKEKKKEKKVMFETWKKYLSSAVDDVSRLELLYFSIDLLPLLEPGLADDNFLAWELCNEKNVISECNETMKQWKE